MSRQRIAFTEAQLLHLNNAYENGLNSLKKKEAIDNLAQQMGISSIRIKNWIGNRRKRDVTAKTSKPYIREKSGLKKPTSFNLFCRGQSIGDSAPNSFKDWAKKWQDISQEEKDNFKEKAKEEQMNPTITETDIPIIIKRQMNRISDACDILNSVGMEVGGLAIGNSGQISVFGSAQGAKFFSTPEMREKFFNAITVYSKGKSRTVYDGSRYEYKAKDHGLSSKSIIDVNQETIDKQKGKGAGSPVNVDSRYPENNNVDKTPISTPLENGASAQWSGRKNPHRPSSKVSLQTESPNSQRNGTYRDLGSFDSLRTLTPLKNDMFQHPSEGRYPFKRPSQSSLVTFSESVTVSRGRDKSTEPLKGDENIERGNWSGRFDFILSMLGYAVGLGNIWRFPYLCYRNGGGAFLIPFILTMAFVGVPLFFLESALGQFSSTGPMTVWKFAPLFKGVGVAMVIVSGLTSIYYNMILAWAQFYFFASFTSEVPWKTCDNKWNTEDCSLKLPIVDCSSGVKAKDGTCNVESDIVGVWNDKLFTNITGRRRISPAEEYWTGYALKESTGIEDIGLPVWYMVLNLLLAWIICFLCLIKGIKSSGKVVYFTAIFPYVLLVVLFFRGVTLEHASIGIRAYIVPEFERLLDPKVWNDAAIQVFFSMGLAGGGLMTLSSYNKFHNDILRDTLIVTIGDTLTCIFAGFVIFSFLGQMAGDMNVDFKEVAKDGPGLAFIVYPAAVSNMTPSTLWSLLFFFMLITLGLDSQFAMLETVLTGCMDQYPHLRPRKVLVNAVICFTFFLLGLPLTCAGGVYLLQIMDNFVGGWTLLVIGLVEIIAVAFVYGCDRFWNDLRIMIGFDNEHIIWRIWYMYCRISWCIISPLVLLGLFIFAWIKYSPSTYGDYKYPVWADILGWIMAFVSVITIPVVMIFKLVKEDDDSSCLGKLRLLVTPNRHWGPALVRHRKLVDYVDGYVVDPDSELKPRRALTKNGRVNYAYSADQSDYSDLRIRATNGLRPMKSVEFLQTTIDKQTEPHECLKVFVNNTRDGLWIDTRSGDRYK